MWCKLYIILLLLVLDNDIEAIESRIYFILDRQPSSLYFIADA